MSNKMGVVKYLWALGLMKGDFWASFAARCISHDKNVSDILDELCNLSSSTLITHYMMQTAYK